MSNWQDSETAPKNGKWLWVFGTAEFGVCWVVANWRDDNWRMPQGDIVVPVQWKPMPDWYDPYNPKEPTEAQLKETGFRVNNGSPLLKDANMSNDLVKRLREVPRDGTAKLDGHDYWCRVGELSHEAADRLEQINELYLEYVDISEERAVRIKKLEAALSHIYAWYPISVTQPRQTIDKIREFARAALEGEDD